MLKLLCASNFVIVNVGLLLICKLLMRCVSNSLNSCLRVLETTYCTVQFNFLYMKGVKEIAEECQRWLCVLTVMLVKCKTETNHLPSVKSFIDV